MKKKLLITLICMILASLAIPAAAFAADITIDDAYVTANPGPYDVGTHNAGDVITITTSLPLTLQSSAFPIAGIQIVCTGNVDISVDSLFVNDLLYNVSPLTFTGTGNRITAIGHSVFVADRTQPGIKVETGNAVSFYGPTGTSIIGQSGDVSDDGTGTAAGIGGGDGVAAGNITVNGALNVQGRASGGGAGIGGGNGATGGTIVVNDGWVEGYSFGGGAGLGGGSEAAGDSITIEDGFVLGRATGGGAGIGGGLRAEGGNITINGGQVDAASLSSGAGIGGGNSSGADGSGNAGTIVITGGSVIGESSSGAGIGSGYLAQGNTGSITISGGTVRGTAANQGAGIGGGGYSSAGTISITGGSVIAQSANGRGLGSGANWGGGSLSIAGTAFVIAEGALVDIGTSFTAFTIGGTAEVFTVNGTIDGTLSTAHTYEPGVLIPAGVDLTGVGNAYNFSSPSGWEASATAGYFIRREQSIAAQQAANPQTGDNSNMYLYVVIAGVMAAIIAAALIARKKPYIIS